MIASGTSATGRNAVIDDLRGVAILMVLLLHFGLAYGIWDKGPIVWLVAQLRAASLHIIVLGAMRDVVPGNELGLAASVAGRVCRAVMPGRS